MDQIAQIHPLVLVLLASLFTWGLTALGAAVVFFFKDVNKRALDIMLGVSGGIMIAAAFWSLIIPAINLADELWGNQWLLPCLGLITGGLFIVITSLILERQYQDNAGKKRDILLVSAITLHNIPEGLAVGVGFSGFAMGTTGCTLLGAIMIALGIGIQNFPDGLAVSLPLYRDGMRKGKAFFFGQASGIIEPIAAVVGYLATMAIRGMLPFFLSFAAGAMIVVVINELNPDIAKENRLLATLGFVLGFAALMILDIVISF